MMGPEAIEDFFAPFAPVLCRRMFSGYGVYVGTACFALVAQGQIWLKADEAGAAALAAAGCQPFSMTTADGKTKTMRAFWTLPEAALDDADALRLWCGPALAAAQRTAEAKAEALTRMRARGGREDDT